MDVYESLSRKVSHGDISAITHDEWAYWSVCGRDKHDSQEFAVTVFHKKGNCTVYIFHTSLEEAAGTAQVLYTIGLVDVPSWSIIGIQISNQKKYEILYWRYDWPRVYKKTVPV